ncbi:putative protein tyrosine phosphatase [Arcicella aurantiaca]|uniref:Phosphotyrosine protein phosphatase I domain-containing protein n=1 Tax=Arcicella aurantiaca TaxID=591202 RepID=A0A316E9B9_9BACT|nr:protein tyrosine phosphatase [Arcicella aurantiaca]PWK26248.1 putative protein tyrosine phosphatase [Arcicella aurantiaca]
MQKLLFVCSQNKWRSLTAEKILENHEDFWVKSAGTENGARVKISAGLIGWADIIFVMEKKHRSRIQEKYKETVGGKPLYVLNIPDDYQFMDEELIEILLNRIGEIIDL